MRDLIDQSSGFGKLSCIQIFIGVVFQWSHRGCLEPWYLIWYLSEYDHVLMLTRYNNVFEAPYHQWAWILFVIGSRLSTMSMSDTGSKKTSHHWSWSWTRWSSARRCWGVSYSGSSFWENDYAATCRTLRFSDPKYFDGFVYVYTQVLSFPNLSCIHNLPFP